MVALLRARRSPATIAKSLAGTVKIAESHQPNPSTAAPSRDYVKSHNVLWEIHAVGAQRLSMRLTLKAESLIANGRPCSAVKLRKRSVGFCGGVAVAIGGN
jgi:hypothetical protein